MHTLYPAIKPNQTYLVPVKEPHVLYLEESGNPDGIPVILLHPGPGGGGDTHLRRFFDPQHYRIIHFDQRGCGRSFPTLELSHNTTRDLVEDIESIRHFLGLEHFTLFGSGWGSLLALIYSQKYPQNVQGLLLCQVLLGRKEDTDWFFQNGASQIYPDYWEAFIKNVPEELLQRIPHYYQKCLQGNNDLLRITAAKSWSIWQAQCSSLQPHLNVLDQFNDLHFALTLATLESYYLEHDYFIEENQIINNVHKIRHIPCHIVHGRYNMVCPLSGAWLLHQNLSASNLSIVRDAGHSDREPGIIDAVIHASQEMAKKDLDAC